jgi:hypothetical protein
MPLRLATLGASGAVGGMLAAQLLRDNLLEADDRLPLVGHGTDPSSDVIRNSVELTVQILSEKTDRHRVIGMAAQQD